MRSTNSLIGGGGGAGGGVDCCTGVVCCEPGADAAGLTPLLTNANGFGDDGVPVGRRGNVAAEFVGGGVPALETTIEDCCCEVLIGAEEMVKGKRP